MEVFGVEFEKEFCVVVGDVDGHCGFGLAFDYGGAGFLEEECKAPFPLLVVVFGVFVLGDACAAPATTVLLIGQDVEFGSFAGPHREFGEIRGEEVDDAGGGAGFDVLKGEGVGGAVGGGDGVG